MNAAAFEAILPAIIKSRVSTLVWGWHGVGKSQIIRKVVREMYGERNTKKDGQELTMIDLRLGQMEIGDLTGIPRNEKTDKGIKTVWGLPDWWPTHPNSKGVLFVDEINRAASPDVLQASFQLVLDYRLHTHSLPVGWSVIAAANPDDNEYQVLRLDPALMDRFLHISFAPTKKDWFRWSENHIEKRFLREFIMATPDALGIKSAPTIPVMPSPRSIELLDRVYSNMTDVERHTYGHTIASGLIGPEMAIMLKKYLSDNMDRPVDAAELLNDFDKVEKTLGSWIGKKNKTKDGNALRETRVDLLKAQFEIVSSFIVTELDAKLTEPQAKNMVRFMAMLPVEVAIAGLGGLTDGNRVGIIAAISPLIVNSPLARKWAKILQTGDTNMEETGSVDE